MKRMFIAWTVASVFALTACPLTALIDSCRFISYKIHHNKQSLQNSSLLLVKNTP